MSEFVEGSVVIVGQTHQAGTIVQVIGRDVWVLLANKDFWRGGVHDIRFPQDDADIASCVLDVGRLK